MMNDMKKMSTMEIVSLGLMLFSIFFGAGNLIFPPALGQAAGTNILPAIAGFLLTGVGLPLLGVLAIGISGGEYAKLIAKRVHPKFALMLLVILNLTVGPLFAVPRTGTVAFEVGIRSFISPDSAVVGQFIYTLLFFGATYLLALNPSKIADRLGKILTPILLLFLGILLAQVFYAPLGDLQMSLPNYQTTPFVQGFKEGYLTMDLLAFISIGAIVVNSIKEKNITNPVEITKLCTIAGLISAFLMSAIYISLAYLGATSVAAFGQAENGGVILTNVASVYFGQIGNIILAVIITFACLTTSCGLSSSCATFFSELSNGRLKYKPLLFVINLFSMVVGNFGLTKLITVSVPFLVTLYPVVIVLVLLSLLHRLFQGRKTVYQYSLFLTLLISIFGGLQAANIPLPAINQFLGDYIPLYQANLGWFVPAILGAVIGYVVSLVQSEENEPECEV
jgi:LIVCS family branched-chain amino acid:cation transporter